VQKTTNKQSFLAEVRKHSGKFHKARDFAMFYYRTARALPAFLIPEDFSIESNKQYGLP
jgi:hypothetical protein